MVTTVKAASKSAKPPTGASTKTRVAPVARKIPAKTAPAVKKAVAAKAPAKALKTAAMPLIEKADKPKKPKLVRDSFTIPKAEYSVLELLKERAAKLAHPVKKSETLRAGIKALAAMPDAAFLAALKAVPAIKTGRPSTDKLAG